MSPQKTGHRHPIAENIDKVVRVENEALQRRSYSEAITDAIGGFVGTISFVLLQVVAFTGWVVVNAEIIPHVSAFRPFPVSVIVFAHLT